MRTEKNTTYLNGFLFVLLVLGLLAGIGYSVYMNSLFFIPTVLLLPLILKGFFIIKPNESLVATLFGKYTGTFKQDGFGWANPFLAKQKISLRARNFDSERIKVNDSLGNPVLISVILVWKVKDTYKAAFDVDNYENFVRVQTDAAVRELAASYPYDNFDDEEADISLRSDFKVINDHLEKMLDERLHIAGIEVLEARIGYLAYAPEIANSMLKRQQATAIVAARLKIVEGAVGMVELALKKLSEKDILEFDEDKKATMVSNLMVVLCGDRDATPVVNTGTLYQ